MKRQVKQLLDESSNLLNETGMGNPAPPATSNWRYFSDVFQIGVLDLDEFARHLEFHNFADLDISITPRSLYNRNSVKFIEALRKSSLRAEDYTDSEIADKILSY